MEHCDFTAAKGKKLAIDARWPSYTGSGAHSAEFAAMAGGTIVRIGAPVGLNLEGGGLAIEYIPKGCTTSRIVLLEFNELGLWPPDQTGHASTASIGE